MAGASSSVSSSEPSSTSPQAAQVVLMVVTFPVSCFGYEKISERHLTPLRAICTSSPEGLVPSIARLDAAAKLIEQVGDLLTFDQLGVGSQTQ